MLDDHQEEETKLTLKPSQYMAILELHRKGVPAHEIAKLLEIAINTVKDALNRLEGTGSIYPSNMTLSIYAPELHELRDRIEYHLNRKKTTCRLGQEDFLSCDEIYAIVQQEHFCDVPRTVFNELYDIERRKRYESHFDTYYQCGHIVEFEWGSKDIHLHKENKRVYFAVYALPYSEHLLAYATANMLPVTFVQTFNNVVQQMGGTPYRLVVGTARITQKVQGIDNLDPQLQRLFAEIAVHYGCKVSFRASYLPEQKSAARRGIKLIKDAFDSSYITELASINEVQSFLDQILDAVNSKKHSRKNDTRIRLFAHELAHVKPLPKKLYSYYDEIPRTVHRDSYVQLNTARYSVPEGYQAKVLQVRHNEHALYVLSKTREVLVKHQIAKKKEMRRRIWHVLHRIRMKPEGFVNSEDYRALPKWLKHLHDIVFRSNALQFVEFLIALQGQKKDLVKQVMRRNHLTWEELQPEMLYRYVRAKRHAAI